MTKKRTRRWVPRDFESRLRAQSEVQARPQESEHVEEDRSNT